MKADVKAQWVKDLRSGEFEQGPGWLNKLDSEGRHHYCCLGVLCEQAVKAGVIPPPELHGSEYRYLDAELDEYGKVKGESFNQASSLPRKVAEWAGNVDEEGRHREDVTIGVGGITAIGANDGAGLTFAEIADLIEQNVSAE